MLLDHTSGLPGGGDQHLVLMFIGFALVTTWVLRIEPAGKSLDEISGRKASAIRARPTPA